MSTAISTLIHPPLQIIALTRIFCGGIFLLGLAVWFELGIRLEWPFDLAVSAVCVFAGMYGFYFSFTLAKSFRISIYFNGRVILCPMATKHECISNTADRNPDLLPATVVAGTTIWPKLIILRLRLENRKKIFVLVTSRSVASETFRTMAVVSRWIVRHNDPAQGGRS